jgi:hypothetical protein
MNAVHFSEILSPTYQTTQCHNPEDHMINFFRHAQLLNKIHKYKHEYKHKQSGFIEILFFRVVVLGHRLSETRRAKDINCANR